MVDPFSPDPVVFRFEDTFSGHVSGISIPFTITAETNLTEEGLYNVEEKSSEIPAGIYEEKKMECDPDDAELVVDTLLTNTDNKLVLVPKWIPSCAFKYVVYDVEVSKDTDTINETDLEAIAYTIPFIYSEGDSINWSITAKDKDAGDEIASESGTYGEATTPPEPEAGTCGDEERQSPNDEGIDEECDGGDGCLMDGADICKCFTDVGWEKDINNTDNTDCLCEGSISISLEDYPDDVPINASLFWNLGGSACNIYSGDNLEIYMEAYSAIDLVPLSTPSAQVGTVTGVSNFSLLDVSDITLIPDTEYKWQVKFDTSESEVKKFRVKCPAAADEIVLMSPDSTEIETTALSSTPFKWQSTTPECLFDATSNDYTVTITDEADNTVCQFAKPANDIMLPDTCVSAIETAGEGQYSWKVKRTDDNGNDAVSDLLTFTIIEGESALESICTGTNTWYDDALDECWIESTEGQSCTNACLFFDSILECEGGLNESGNPAPGGTYASWNVTDEICTELGYEMGSSAPKVHAPFIDTAVSECRPRTITESYPGEPTEPYQDCTSSAVIGETGYPRICKCKL